MSVAFAAHANFEGQVTKVLEGGRLVVNTGKQDVIVNLRSLIVPFPNQNMYEQSRMVADRVFLGRDVKVVTSNSIDDSCIYGELFSNGINLNEALLMTGYAWIYNQADATQRYIDIEAQNTADQRGLWNEELHFQFASIPYEATYMLQKCFAKGVGVVEEKDQIRFTQEKNRFGFGKWVESAFIGIVLGFILWFSIFWFDGLGVDLLKPFRKKKKDSDDE